jgi:hypothetical protein
LRHLAGLVAGQDRADAGGQGEGGGGGLKGGKECWGVDGPQETAGDGLMIMQNDPTEDARDAWEGDVVRDSAVDEGRIEMRGYRVCCALLPTYLRTYIHVDMNR